MAALTRLLTDRDLFEQRVLTPLCIVGAVALLLVLLLHRLGML